MDKQSPETQVQDALKENQQQRAVEAQARMDKEAISQRAFLFAHGVCPNTKRRCSSEACWDEYRSDPLLPTRIYCFLER